jgi:hypothetical protein
VDATPQEIEQLAQACQPAAFGLNKEEVMDETYRKAGKMDIDCFSTLLTPDHTDLIKIVRNYLLEGADSSRQIKVELYKLTVYSMRLIHIHAQHKLSLLPRQRVILQAARRYATRRKDVQITRCYLSSTTRGRCAVPPAPRRRMGIRLCCHALGRASIFNSLRCTFQRR